MQLTRIQALVGVGAVLYCGAVTWYLLVHGGWPTPDFLIPPLLLLALVAGRGRAFLLDWTPFLLLLLAWEATRGIADRLGMPVLIEWPAEVERALFFGHIPTVTLQGWLYDPERGSRWYDWVGAVMHALHFVVPVAFGFVLWLRDRALYWRYVASVLALFVLSFVGYVLFPAAPPWIAGTMDVIPFSYRIGVGTLLSLPVGDRVVLAYDHIRPNHVAAMPSLHAAVPLLLTLILWRLKRPLAWLGVVYTLTLGFFLVYHGEHYVIDLLAGWALAGLVYWLVWAPPHWVRERLPRSTVGRRRALVAPATALAGLLLVVGTAAVLRPNVFGTEPNVLLPEPAQDEAHAGLEEERQTFDGPCGVSQTLAGAADALLAPVAGAYTAYLLDPSAGLCMALTQEQAQPPPALQDWQRIAAQAGSPAAPVTSRGLEAATMRVSAAGRPSARLTAAGMPPGRYLLVVLLRDVPDAEAAIVATADIARLVFDGS